jgi:ParB family chromosome partitioning protein
MAKRKRLSPALLSADIGPETGSNGPLETHSRPPIAQVAGETAEHAAFAELTRTLTEAREEGRLIQRLPLAEIETGHLVRDRMVFDAAEMAALVASLRARGQQVPIEVVARAEGGYGLISGLRRVMALARSERRRSWRWCAVPRPLRRPISPWSRKTRSAPASPFTNARGWRRRRRSSASIPTPRRRSGRCFTSASPAKRSKIGSFVRVHEALGHALRYPAAIPERLGLALAAVLDRDGQAAAAGPGARRCDAHRQRGGARSAGKGAERGAENRL